MMKNEFSKINLTWEIAHDKAKDDTKWDEIVKQLMNTWKNYKYITEI